MAYKIDWVGTVAIGLETPGGRTLAFSLEEDQQVPVEFKEGDYVRVTNHPEDSALLAMGFENGGYYEITHIRTGKVLRTWHRADMYKVEGTPKLPGL
ncbi:MAG: hypothetical protein ACR2JE_13385 [Acidobacteriaceae bacterium]